MQKIRDDPNTKYLNQDVIRVTGFSFRLLTNMAPTALLSDHLLSAALPLFSRQEEGVW